MQPDVSVVIPTYNRRDLVKEAIQSCFAGNEALEIEVVVVDDGSTDGTREYLRTLNDERIRPIFQKHQGPQVARNHGLSEARGRFVKFLDSDDMLVEGALVEEVDALQKAGCDVAYGDLVTRSLLGDGGEQRTCNYTTGDLVSGIFKGTISTIPPVFLYRTEAVSDAEWDPSIPYHQDTAFAIAVATRSPDCIRIDRVVAVHRWHEGKRIATFKAASPTVEKLRLQANLIRNGIERMRLDGQLLDQHRRAAAKGLWQWGHMLAPYDWAAFKDCYDQAKRLFPGFRPDRDRWLLYALDSLWSPGVTERLMLPARRFKKWVGEQ